MAKRSVGFVDRTNFTYPFDHLWFPCHDAAAATAIAYRGRLDGEAVSGTVALAGTTGAMFDAGGNATPAANGAFQMTGEAIDRFMDTTGAFSFLALFGLRFPSDAASAARGGIIQFGSITNGIVIEYSTGNRIQARFLPSPGDAVLLNSADPTLTTATQYHVGVLYNLIDNAIRSTMDGGTVINSGALAAGQRTTAVAGQGLGIWSRRTGTPPITAADFIAASTDATIREMVICKIPASISLEQFQAICREYRYHPREYLRTLRDVLG